MVCAVLSRISDLNLIDQAAETGTYFLEQLKGLAAEGDLIQEVRGRGLMIAVELSPSASIERIHRDLSGRGYIAGLNVANRVLRLYPPLIIERPMIDGFIQNLREALSAI